MMLIGGNFRKKGWSPWVILLGTCVVLAVIALNILRHTEAFTR